MNSQERRELLLRYDFSSDQPHLHHEGGIGNKLGGMCGHVSNLRDGVYDKNSRSQVIGEMYLIYGWVASKYVVVERDLNMLKDKLGVKDEAYEFLSEFNLWVHELGESINGLITLIHKNNFQMFRNSVEIKRTQNTLNNMKRLDKGNRYWKILGGRQ